MLPILYHESSAHTHIFFLLLPSSRLLCRTHTALPFFSTSLICLLQRAPRTPSYRQQAREPIDRVVVHDSSRLNPVSTFPSRILTTNHGTHCIDTRILLGVHRTASSSALLPYTCTPDTLYAADNPQSPDSLIQSAPRAGANWVYPPRFSFFVTADTLLLLLLPLVLVW